MAQRGQHAGFALEAPQARRIAAERGRQGLDRDFAPQGGVDRTIDAAHAAGSEQLEDLVATKSCPGASNDSESGAGESLMPTCWFPDELLRIDSSNGPTSSVRRLDELARVRVGGEERLHVAEQIVVASARALENSGRRVGRHVEAAW